MNRLRGLALILFGFGGIIIGIAVLGYASLDSSQPEEPLTFQVTPEPTKPLPTPVASPTPASTAPVARLQVPAVGIDANVQTIGVDRDGTMQSPQGPKDVGWYTFSARPGYVGNVVISGHVDYINYGPAVFWRLRDLKGGDEVIVTLQDGSSFRYRIVSLTSYDEATAPVLEIVGPTANETITLITCTGVFDHNSREYNKRLVVRGERVLG